MNKAGDGSLASGEPVGVSGRPWATTVLVVLIAGLALGLRLYRFELPGTDGLTALNAGLLPPGLHLDEAFNGIAAWHAVRAGEFSPFVRIDLGRMPIHIYTTSLIYALAGEPLVVGPRLAALLAGLLGVPVFAACAAAIWRHLPPASAPGQAAVFAAGVMAVTYWPVHFSRVGLEHASHVVFASAALGLLAWALRQPGPGKAALAGAAMGVAVYTYPVAYLLPVIGAATVGWCGWRGHWQRRDWLRFAPPYAAAMALILLPLVVFAIREPGWLLDRPDAVAVRSLRALGRNLVQTLLGLVWRGDVNVSYNLPGRPLLDPVQAILLIVGLGQCARRFREVGCALLLVWLSVMLLPQVLSQAPHFGRVVGAVPPLLLIVTLGAGWVWRAVTRWLGRAWPGTALMGGLLLVSGGLTARDYFLRWPQASDLAATFRVAERIEAEASRLAPAGWAQFVTPVDHRLSTIAFITGDTTPLRSFNGRGCTVIAPAGQPARYFITGYEDAATSERLAWLFGTGLPEQVYPATGSPLVRIIDAPAARPVALPGLAVAGPDWRIGDLLEPLSARVTPAAPHPGDTIHVRLLMNVLSAAPENYTLGLYILGPGYPAPGFGVISQADSGPCDGSYPTTDWQPDEWIIEDRQMTLPVEADPGNYALALAVYRLADLQRLPVTNNSGEPAGDLLPLSNLTIAAP